VRSNGLLKWLLIPIVLIVGFVGLRLYSHRSAHASRGDQTPELTEQEAKSLGIGGDTPHDTVATLVAQVKQMRSELKTALDENKESKAENGRLRQRESNIDQRIQSALASEHDHARQDRDQETAETQQTRNVLLDLQHRVEAFTGKAGAAHSDLPVGLGLEGSDADSIGDQIKWIEPQDARLATKAAMGPDSQTSTKAFQFSEPSSPTDSLPTKTAGSLPEGEAVRDINRPRPGVASRKLKPVYTLPSDSTLIGSIAMTALIGRVPVDGVVNDPYPFKALIGPDNLTANGIDLPNVAGAVVSGTASGDWTLSCVRGRIRSLTFVFNDGTIRTVRSAATSEASEALTAQSGMGWISDPYGIPCVSGERRSNAAQYLSSEMLITAAGAGAASLIKNQSDSVSYVNGNGTSLGTVGISGSEAMWRHVSVGE
jgi:integrating conjugative element protein (TIGR03752 family)